MSDATAANVFGILAILTTLTACLMWARSESFKMNVEFYKSQMEHGDKRTVRLSEHLKAVCIERDAEKARRLKVEAALQAYLNEPVKPAAGDCKT